jgi:carbon storage regulator CsrA
MEHGRLSLARKTDEPIVFQYTDEHGNEQEIILSVTQIKGAQVRLMMDAPKSVKIVRQELLN